MEDSSSSRKPIGTSLKGLRGLRDRLMPFVTKNTDHQRHYKQRQTELDERQTAVEAKENDLKQKEEELLSNRINHDELLKENIRIEKSFKKIEEENYRLKNKLANEIKNFKTMEAKHLGEIGIIEKEKSELRKNIRKHKKEIKSISLELESSKSSLEDYKSKFNKVSLSYEQKIVLCDTFIKDLSKTRKENNELTSEINIKVIVIKDLEAINSNLKSRLERLKNELVAISKNPSKKYDLGLNQLKSINNDVFSDLDVIHKLSENVTELIQPPDCITTIGSGPFLEEDFDEYLKCLDITPVSGGGHWIIVGRDGWDEGKLIELIEDNDLDEVVVLSQELFVAGIISTHDPFSLPDDILMKFADGHPALEFLMKQGFEWPEIILEELDEPRYVLDPRGSYDRVEESPLCLMGYRVGETRGLPYQKRRNILQKTYSDTIPWVGDDDYMEEWGQPSRTKRLWRMAHHIAREINKRKKIPNMKRAVGDWKEDLDWLKETYYKNGMHFKWPNI
jgi:predicted  nucleic acid-binding Zn-ribbon protein